MQTCPKAHLFVAVNTNNLSLLWLERDTNAFHRS